jgi:hypothetical protein
MTMLDPGSDRLLPTWRKPVGIIALVVALALYAGLVAHLAESIGGMPVLAQTLAYIVLGTIWLLPLRRFLIWMETGRWG